MAWDGKPKNVVGREVQRRRIQLGLSQPELAARCQLAGWDISRGIVAGIEGRMRCISDFEVMILAHVLGVAVPDLFPEDVRQVDWASLGVPFFLHGKPKE